MIWYQWSPCSVEWVGMGMNEHARQNHEKGGGPLKDRQSF